MNKGAYLRLTTLFPFQKVPFLIYLKLAEVLTVKACWVKCFTMRVSCGLLMVSLKVLNCGLVVNERIKKAITHLHSLFFHWHLLLPYALPLYLSSVFLDNCVKGHQARLQPPLAFLFLSFELFVHVSKAALSLLYFLPLLLR